MFSMYVLDKMLASESTHIGPMSSKRLKFYGSITQINQCSNKTAIKINFGKRIIYVRIKNIFD